MRVGEKLKAVRKHHKLTQKDVASAVGISESHLSNIENGRENPSLTLIKLFSYKYDVSEEWLLTYNNDFFDNAEYVHRDGSYEYSNEEEESFVSVVNDTERMRQRFDSIRIRIEKLLLEQSQESDVRAIIDCFYYLESILNITPYYKLLDNEEFTRLLESTKTLIYSIYNLIFNAANRHDRKNLISIKNDCSKELKNIEENAKSAANVYLSLYGDEMKL
jgi:transcriptional regulator with XRE-family HTH domain